MIKEIPDNIKDKLYTLEINKEIIEKELTRYLKDYLLLKKFNKFDSIDHRNFDADDEFLFYNLMSNVKTEIKIKLRLLKLLQSLIVDIYDKYLMKGKDNKDMFYTKIAIYKLQHITDIEDDFIKENINLTLKFL